MGEAAPLSEKGFRQSNMAAATSGTGFDRAGALRRQANVRTLSGLHAGGGQPPFQVRQAARCVCARISLPLEQGHAVPFSPKLASPDASTRLAQLL